MYSTHYLLAMQPAATRRKSKIRSRTVSTLYCKQVSFLCHNFDLSTGLDPYNYTTGRWLSHDETEREARFIRFNFDALCQKIVKACTGATSIMSYDKIEGAFNRVFIFHTDNSKRIVAKLPFPLAGPSRLTTNSEIATIQYCKLLLKDI